MGRGKKKKRKEGNWNIEGRKETVNKNISKCNDRCFFSSWVFIFDSWSKNYNVDVGGNEKQKIRKL